VERDLTAAASNNGSLSHAVTGTIPFKIQYNQEKKVPEVKGTGLGAGTTKFTSPNCDCSATWGVEFTVSGTLVPSGGLIAEGSEGGCYIQIHITEDWGIYDAVCNCDMGSAMVQESPGIMYFGPFKFDLINGAEVLELQSQGNTSWAYRWAVQKLDVPLASGCVAGETIERE
jgi:hypothetical protein